MKLSDKQIQKALGFIVQKTGDKPVVCPVCGNTQWKDIVTEIGDAIIPKAEGE